MKTIRRETCLILLLGYLLTLGHVQTAHAEELCSGVNWVGDPGISLTATEKRLVCGDRDGTGPNAESWRTIPFPQAKFNLETYLQNSGHYQSKIIRENGGILIDAGPVTRVNGVEVAGAPVGFDISRRREVMGELLTPRILDQLQQWSAQRLQQMGYPCPELESTADPMSGVIRIEVNAGRPLSFYKVIETPIEGLAPGVLRRYDAFRLGDPFDGRLPRVTASRVLRDGAVQSIHFGVKCEPAGAVLTQETIAGPPRLLSFGVGVDTEGLVLLRTSWKNTRLGKMGSLLDLSAFGSTKEQRMNLSVDWYHLPYPSRRFIRPMLEFKHENEEPFEAITGRAETSYATTYDDDLLGVSIWAGPAFEIVQTVRGAGPLSAQFLSMDARVVLMTHEFEFYRTSPRTGYAAELSSSFNSKDLYSDVSAQQLRLGGQILFNLGDYDRPRWVVGARGAVATLITPERLGIGTGLPATFRRYLGGSRDLRGFGRQELPENGLGGLSSAFLGIELRSGGGLPLGMEPFVFTDLGALGKEPLSLSAPLFWSPGLGVRWASPIGIFRASIAHGYVSGERAEIVDPDSLSHFQFYLSLGEEF